MIGRSPRRRAATVPGMIRSQFRSPAPYTLPHRAIRVGRPYVTAYVCANVSVIALEASYGSVPASGSLSTYGRRRLLPYALTLDATAIATGGSVARRHASSTFQVPMTLVANVATGSRRA